MSKFFNKESLSFVGSFLFFLFVSISFLVGLSAYAEARGVELPAGVGYILTILGR